MLVATGSTITPALVMAVGLVVMSVSVILSFRK